MSGHDSHHPPQETKGIWALPLTAWIIVIIMVFFFTIDRSKTTTAEGHGEGHEKTEAHH
ncbi:hypothetical protein ACJVDH_16660 [Pedobacter sp. AW1-32]|uniref:hypothetical protein n=1 Tax=Pedobacter sp. AW1-32 TaxID=3383026 RepID=UPI003FEFAF70